jgi:hypothetical protein
MHDPGQDAEAYQNGIARQSIDRRSSSMKLRIDKKENLTIGGISQWISSRAAKNIEWKESCYARASSEDIWYGKQSYPE